MSTQLDTLTAKVAAAVGAEASAVTLIEGLSAEVKAIAAQLAAAGTDTAALDALSAQLDAATTGLASAVAANPVDAPAAPATPTA